MHPRPVPDELLAQPFTPDRAERLGVTRNQLRGPAYRAVCRGVYAAADVPDTAGVRLAALRLVLVPGFVVSGATATWLLGADCRRRVTDPIEVTVAPGTHPRHRGALLRARQAPLDSGDIRDIEGVAVTSPERTAFDMARRPDRGEGVVVLDALWAAGLVTPDQLRDYAAAHPRWRGVRQIAQVAALANRRAENPMESRLRMALVLDGKLPTPDVQPEVFDQHGDLVGRVDLGYCKERVAVEFDGRIHERPGIRVNDMRRQNRLVSLGWRVLIYSAADVYGRPGLIRNQVWRELRRAA